MSGVHPPAAIWMSICPVWRYSHRGRTLSLACSWAVDQNVRMLRSSFFGQSSSARAIPMDDGGPSSATLRASSSIWQTTLLPSPALVKRAICCQRSTTARVCSARRSQQHHQQRGLRHHYAEFSIKSPSAVRGFESTLCCRLFRRIVTARTSGTSPLSWTASALGVRIRPSSPQRITESALTG